MFHTKSITAKLYNYSKLSTMIVIIMDCTDFTYLLVYLNCCLVRTCITGWAIWLPCNFYKIYSHLFAIMVFQLRQQLRLLSPLAQNRYINEFFSTISVLRESETIAQRTKRDIEFEMRPMDSINFSDDTSNFLLLLLIFFLHTNGFCMRHSHRPKCVAYSTRAYETSQ